MNIPDKSDFQPSAQTLGKWLAARKPTLQVSGVQMPGFFIDSGNSADTGWFYVALAGEVIGLCTTMYGGFKSGGIFSIIIVKINSKRLNHPKFYTSISSSILFIDNYIKIESY